MQFLALRDLDLPQPETVDDRGECVDHRTLRRDFLVDLVSGLRVVWPILSVLLVLIVLLGATVGALEGWSVAESIYFSFVTALTIGYGDLAPSMLLTRMLAILIGVCGILLTALVAAVAVKALNIASRDSARLQDDDPA